MLNLISQNEYQRTNEDGSVTISNTTSYAITGYILYLTGKLNEGNYTLKNYSDKIIYVMFNSSDYTHGIPSNGVYSFNYDGISYLRIQSPDVAANTSITIKAMLIKGIYTLDTFPDYIPHTEKTYNFPLSSGQKLMEGSYLASDGIHNVRKQVTFDGSEDWKSAGDLGNVTRYYIENSFTPKTRNALCDYFRNIYDFSLDEPHFYLNLSGTHYMFININSTSNFKTWLSQNKPVIEYELAEEEIIPYTPEQKAVYDEIMSDGTYEGVTHYTAEAIINPNIDMTYYKDLQIELSDYVKNTDYAIEGKGGVIKVNSVYMATSTTSSGTLQTVEKTYSQYQNLGNSAFIGKGTLENVIEGKGLVSDTDYATDNKGGTIKVNGYGLQVANGTLIGLGKTYAEYNNGANQLLISKQTLENVIEGKGLVSDTNYASISKAGVIKTSSDYATDITGQGRLCGQTILYANYQDKNNAALISKGTLENVIEGKGLVNQTTLNNKIKNENSTTAGDTYDVRYINSMIGNIETLLGGI